jgi:hypothetical protein
MENQDNQQLVPRRSDLAQSNKISLTASEQRLAVELNLTSLNSKTVPEGELVQEFSREFADESPELIQWAFREHRRLSPFFPAISEIDSLIRMRKARLREDAVEERRRAEQAEINRRRAAGELVSVDEVRRILKKAADKCAMESPRMQCAEELQVRPPLELSREEWEIRRNTEKARLDAYLAARG